MEDFSTSPINSSPQPSPQSDKQFKPIDFSVEKNIPFTDSLLHNELQMYLTSSNTISGRDFLKLFQYAASLGITDAALKAYLITQGVTIDSKNPPEELNRFISYH